MYWNRTYFIVFTVIENYVKYDNAISRQTISTLVTQLDDMVKRGCLELSNADEDTIDGQTTPTCSILRYSMYIEAYRGVKEKGF